MELAESFAYFERFRKSVCQEDVLAIASICKTLVLPQKTLAVTQHLFFATKAESRIEPDDVVLISSAVSLACKTSETLRPIEKIVQAVAKIYLLDIDEKLLPMYVEAIANTEIEIAVIVDFDFEITEIYTKLEKLCKETHLDSTSSKRCWIMLNDIMRIPLSIYFTIDELLTGVLFINYSYNTIKAGNTAGDCDSYMKFIESTGLALVKYTCIRFVGLHLLNTYSS